jgi:DNA repair protein RecO (recombination protein O)
MISKSKGIVIRTIKYGESSAITNVLTEQFGLVGFHIPSAFKNKGKTKISYLQPLNAVEISFNFQKTKSLQSISDISCLQYPDLRAFNQQAFYQVLCELLQQIVKENEINHALFHYLYDEALPGMNTDLHFWQLPYVMLSILHHYGCAPNIDTYDEDSSLDLKNGIFLNVVPNLKNTADSESSAIIYEMMTRGINHLEVNSKTRQTVVKHLVNYYRLHIHEDFDLRSMEILTEVSLGR